MNRFSDHQGPYIAQPRRRRRATITYALALRLKGLPVAREDQHRLQILGERILRCAIDPDGWKCRSLVCPRCQARAAKQREQEIAALLLATNKALHVHHVTLTLASESLSEGQRTLVAHFGRLRRRSAWFRHVRGGLGQIEFAPSQGGVKRWNVHLHVLCWCDRRMPVKVIARAWKQVLDERGDQGSSRITYAERNLWVQDATTTP